MNLYFSRKVQKPCYVKDYNMPIPQTQSCFIAPASSPGTRSHWFTLMPELPMDFMHFCLTVLRIRVTTSPLEKFHMAPQGGYRIWTHWPHSTALNSDHNIVLLPATCLSHNNLMHNALACSQWQHNTQKADWLFIQLARREAEGFCSHNCDFIFTRNTQTFHKKQVLRS